MVPFWRLLCHGHTEFWTPTTIHRLLRRRLRAWRGSLYSPFVILYQIQITACKTPFLVYLSSPRTAPPHLSAKRQHHVHTSHFLFDSLKAGNHDQFVRVLLLMSNCKWSYQVEKDNFYLLQGSCHCDSAKNVPEEAWFVLYVQASKVDNLTWPFFFRQYSTLTL